ncbi:disease resistance protein TAO1 [Brassica rapa]|uniref:disease resistance protein TAO1 n=1 Tax=Brassica campestris TaxID=3711 RepID=UPI00142E38ED|nr:disease resistance protein TAO1 [Brassica rapa]
MLMDSSFPLINVVAAAINLFTLLGTIFFLFFYRKSRSHQENKTVASSLSLLSPPSSLPQKWKHHVFPSFHGADVRKAFLSHVLKEFRRKGIDPFIDNDMERSKSIGSELIEAIRGSRIALVLLSKNYASSTWCLNELVEIIKCREELDHTVMVLFYEVDPADVKTQTGDFGKVFRKTCKGKTKEEIGRWKHALAEVAKITGYHSRNWDKEADMIEKIATDVSNKLNNSTPSSDFEGLVGMDSHVTKMELLLRLDSDEVRIIGILGPPGIGKTTIARFLFNQHSGNFQLSVFMKNIKTKYAIPACSDDYAVKLYLHEQFMSQLFNEKSFTVSHLGTARDRLKDKKVLVVLDDVDKLVQLEAMARETCWFGPRSRIIITTQDQKLLKASGINHVYKVDFPSNDEALQMFCMYAFGQKNPKDGFVKLACEVTRLVGELPLGLRVMGSYFRGMSKQEWKRALPRLMTRLDGEIESILMISYDALSDEDKSLFLHIACFFDCELVDIVEGCLANSFLDVTQGLHVLAEKSLLSMDSGVIEMHKLLVQLGREIVRKQSVSKPGKRQFLYHAKDIGEVLSDDKAENFDNGATSNVIGIDLPFCDGSEEDIACTSERAFERLSSLQFLRICGDGINPRSLNSISQKLRLLSWIEFRMSCFPSSFNPKFLVQLDMRYSKLEKLWEKTQPLSNLKWMDLRFSANLKELPDLSTATNLCDLDLRYCSSLVRLPSSIGNTVNLQKLNLGHCLSLVELPYTIGKATNLKYLDIRHCSNLVELPSTIGNITNLEELNLSYCSSLVELPSSMGNLHKLSKLDLNKCSNLEVVPANINVASLIEPNLSDCSLLKSASEVEPLYHVLSKGFTYTKELARLLSSA